jgi:cystathionine gamma-synthase/O-succinylhomoserine sulfhydrylase
MDGQGRVLAGAVCGSKEFVEGPLIAFQRNTGPNLSPFSAWVVLKGLETLELRAQRQSENAMKVARFLEGRVPTMLCPFLPSHPQHDLAVRQMSAAGPIFSFVVDGGRRQAHAILDALQLIDISNNIGDAKSLMCHPASSTHANMGAEAREAMGVGEGMLRMNVGLEDPDDVIEDLDQALARAGL